MARTIGAFASFAPLAPPIRAVRPSLSWDLRRARMAAASYAPSSLERIEWIAAPVLIKGDVQRGFGRGSRDLGTPTANLPGKLLADIEATKKDGVYIGFGSVPPHSGKTFKMVANLGHNITYGDVKERVFEAYLMTEGKEESVLPREFYGDEMRISIAAYLRPEIKFNSLQELIGGIANDIRVAKAALDDPRAEQYRTLPFFRD